MNEKLVNYFLKLKDTNKMSHSFLLANISLDIIENGITRVISDFIFNEKIDLYNNLDINIIKPEGLMISKDQILTLQEKIATMSMARNKKVYIIDSCEKLNEYAANSLLKTLEEPNDNIFAFLITNNIDMVMPTIKSRCQIMFISSENKSTINENLSPEDLKLAIEFITLLEKNQVKSIGYYNFIQKIDKEQALKVFQLMLYIYRDAINYMQNDKLEYFTENAVFDIIISNNDIEFLSKKMLIINDIITKLNYNLNMGLIIDKFIIDFGGVK